MRSFRPGCYRSETALAATAAASANQGIHDNHGSAATPANQIRCVIPAAHTIRRWR